jgi:hypothetical protein
MYCLIHLLYGLYFKEYKLKQLLWKAIWRCTPMFIAALFTLTKLWKQSRCPTTDEWIKEMWYIFTMQFFSAIKKNEIMFAGKWMELESIMLSKVS